MDQKQKKSGIRYLDPVFDSVQVSKDIFFVEVTNFKGKIEKLSLDVYTPFNDSKKGRPAIMWIHGGGFRPGNDKTQKYIVQMSQKFARRGYVCFSIDYRVRETPKDDIQGTVSDAASDAMLALNWIRANNKKYGIDKNKLVVGGGSAGGMTAVNLCYKDETISGKWDKKGIIALVNLWGSPDQSRMFAKIDPDDPPTIIIHGTADELVPFANSEQLVKELEKNKIRYELITIEGGKHTPVDHMDDFSGKISEFLYSILPGH
jgi:acetyl esterase/lipase